MLPARESVIAEIVKWALECVREHRVPTFASDPIGLAQELNKVFNTWTELPVIVHPRIARINQIYTNNGIGLRYVDAGSEEAAAMIGDARCVVLIPRRFDATRYGEFRVANVTGWPTQAEKAAGKVFILSDQADLEQLLRFVKETRPKTLLTFRAGGKVLAELVTKRFGIMARVLSAEVRPPKQNKVVLDEVRLGKCEGYILSLIQANNLTYEKREIIGRALEEGFKIQEVEETLSRLTQSNSLKYSEVTQGYSLPEKQP
jgi:hypothetical protein